MDLQAKKTALRKIPHGLTVAGVKQGDELNAFTLTWLTQASFDPPRVVIGVRKDSKSFAMVESDRVFSVNILGQDQQAIAEHFVKPVQMFGDKLGTVGYSKGKTGAPILDEAIAFFECEVREIANQDGDHAVVIGEVVEAGVRKDTPALTLAHTGWHYGG